MPTYVKQLFTDSGKEILGQVKWGQKVNCNYPGIYVVAITEAALAAIPSIFTVIWPGYSFNMV
jgi:hypothetical protein